MRKLNKTWGISIGFFVLAVFALITLVPFFWIVVSSFKTYRETVQIPVVFFPASFTNLDNYKELFGRLNFLSYYKNNIINTIGITFPQLFLSSLAAYAFARIDFPFKNVIFVSLLLALMIPIQMILMPRYKLILDLGLFDSYLGIIIPSIPSVTTTFYMRQQIMSLPWSLDESAYLDGAGHFRIFWSILLPLCHSALLATGIMCLVFSWNDFLWPLVVINSTEKYTLSIAVANLQGQHLTRDNLLLTAAVVVSLPMVVVFIISQRYFIEGIALSGIKE
ncbi:MAG: carbohydrate ABC transporter permease [Sphaerochaeta sp.]|jgi:multiple sugar transport system permease protein|uniref:carbohydrate ABC transporter permease n=1 Tax=Sphaerochaeta sp. TaxID=1972642 RepID=UPI002A367710|nr:carbohydrate ABC transporter permease [Sphaerochaeta sp.]MDX9825595.1 carbohydrate ABC transporter permease [Sphaerochaeta sp.]